MTPISLTLPELRQKAVSFLAIRSIEHLANLMDVSQLRLEFFAATPDYNAYWVKKKKNGLRLIENPCVTLKEMQRTLNVYLQSIYHFVRTEAAYGFIRTYQNEKHPRNIISNAGQHTKKAWMLNLDLIDFFHHITFCHIEKLFKSPIFGFDESLSITLAKLLTYKGHLPIGAPTSPILSNLVTIQFDQELLAYSQINHQTYTRFADDLTFSSNEVINLNHYLEIEAICRKYDFEINPTKTTFFGPHQPKIVTGLVVSDGVDVPDEYYQQLLCEIEKYEHCREIKKRYGQTNDLDLKKYEQELNGAIQFVTKVVGTKAPKAQYLKEKMTNAQRPFEEFMAVSWLDFDYT